jgi:hypothetical protein
MHHKPDHNYLGTFTLFVCVSPLSNTVTYQVPRVSDWGGRCPCTHVPMQHVERVKMRTAGTDIAAARETIRDKTNP